MCGEIRLCTFVRFVRYVITTIRACYALLRSRSALCLYGFCRMALQLLGTLERRRGALCPFAFLLTMEKLQLYSPRRLCYNSLVLGVSRCTGQEISACRDASFGRSKLGRSKLGRNGDCSGTSAPIRLKKKIGKRNDSAETLTVFGGITLKTIRSNFAAGARAVPLKQRDDGCHSANCVSFCVFVWSLARRSSRRSCQPEATRPQEDQAVKRKNGFLSNRGGLRIQEKTPHETAAKVSPLRPGSVSEPAVQGQHTLNPQPVRIKEHRQLLSICQQLQPSSAVWCSPPPSQMAGRTPHAVSY